MFGIGRDLFSLESLDFNNTNKLLGRQDRSREHEKLRLFLSSVKKVRNRIFFCCKSSCVIKESQQVGTVVKNEGSS